MGVTRQRRIAVLVVLLAFAWLGGCMQMTSGASGAAGNSGKVKALPGLGTSPGNSASPTPKAESSPDRQGLGASMGLDAIPGDDETRVDLPNKRSYYVHLPPKSDGRPKSVVIALHGMFLTVARMAWDTNLNTLADKNDFVLVYGVGAGGTWNVGDGCCGFAGARKINDVQYLLSVVDDLGTKIQIDRSRIYLMGFSAGDSLAMAAQCARPDVFAATAGSSGALLAPCRSPKQQIRILHMHGSLDATVPYRGGNSPVIKHVVPDTSRLAAQVRAGAPNSLVTTKLLPCGHLWPRKDNACRYDGTAAAWKWLSQFARVSPITN